MKKKRISSRRAAIPVRAIDFVMYNTKNIHRAREFYQRLFGLKRGAEWSDFWSEFTTEPVTFCLNGTGHKRHPEWDLERAGVRCACGGRRARSGERLPQTSRKNSHQTSR